ncbi:MAG: hypothetical protein MK085_08105 [Phycisphaerales bacterium]|nr:hypothetical protein [Phycisphaerales bacterium]
MRYARNAWLRLLLLAAVPLGCAQGIARNQPGGHDNPVRVAPPEVQRAWSVIRNAQASRLEALDHFATSAQLSLAWREDGRDRWEQADARIWWTLPDRMALRLSRVGTRLLMAGWRGDTWWVFDETGDDTTLSIFPLSGRGQGEDRLLSPPMLLVLTGLLPFPEEPPADLALVGEDVFRFTIRGLAADGEGSLRGLGLSAEVELDARGPRRLVLRSGDREVARSELDRRTPVERDGSAMGAWPVLPFVVNAVFPGPEGHDGRMILSIDRPRAGKEPPARLFDLDGLTRSIEPASVEDQRVSP